VGGRGWCAGTGKPEAGQGVAAAKAKSGGNKQTAAAAAAAMEQQDLQKTIEQASNDRAALMRNLMEYLKSIAIVAAAADLPGDCGIEPANPGFLDGDGVCGANGALDPGDLSTNLLSVQLRSGMEMRPDGAGDELTAQG